MVMVRVTIILNVDGGFQKRYLCMGVGHFLFSENNIVIF